MNIRVLSFVVLFGVGQLHAAAGQNPGYPDAVCVELHGWKDGCVKVFKGATNPITGWLHALTCSGKMRSVFKRENGTVLGTEAHERGWPDVPNVEVHFRNLLGGKPTASSAAVVSEGFGSAIQLYNASAERVHRVIKSGLYAAGDSIPSDVIDVFKNHVANTPEQLAAMSLAATPPAQSLLRNPTVIACCAAAAVGAAWLVWNRLSKKSSEDSSE